MRMFKEGPRKHSSDVHGGAGKRELAVGHVLGLRS